MREKTSEKDTHEAEERVQKVCDLLVGLQKINDIDHNTMLSACASLFMTMLYDKGEYAQALDTLAAMQIQYIRRLKQEGILG